MLDRLNRWMDQRKILIIFWTWLATYPLVGIAYFFPIYSLVLSVAAVVWGILLVMLCGLCVLRMKLGWPAVEKIE